MPRNEIWDHKHNKQRKKETNYMITAAKSKIHENHSKWKIYK